MVRVGMIGQDHIRRLSTVLAGAQVTAVNDADGERARQVADRLGTAKAHGTGQGVIEDSNVDAVLVCSWGPSHEEFVTAAIRAGKLVFCEKPLATTEQACWDIVQAEVKHGSRLVQVVFMCRYDTGYRALQQAVASGDIGTPIIFGYRRARHRRDAVAVQRRRMTPPEPCPDDRQETCDERGCATVEPLDAPSAEKGPAPSGLRCGGGLVRRSYCQYGRTGCKLLLPFGSPHKRAALQDS